MAEQTAGVFRCGGMLSQNPRMRELFGQARAFADVDAPLLIEGGSGAGKTELARAVHQFSTIRRSGRLMIIHCAAMPESLVACELFGYLKSTFIGPTRTYPGVFEKTEGGTLLLKCVESLPLGTQANLFRAIVERRFVRVGDNREIEVDVRLIATTYVSLKEEADIGTFLPDLLCLLSARRLRLPPLGQRPEDVQLLARHFAKKFSDPDRPPADLTAETVDALLSWPWHGNVRELENVIEVACIRAGGGLIRPKHLPLR